MIDMEGKGCESVIHGHDHDHDLWLAMLVWVNIPDSDWGDFRRRHAVDISSLVCIHSYNRVVYFGMES